MLAIICVGSGHRILSENALNRSDANVLKGCAPGSPPPSLDHGKARQCRQGKTGKDQKTGLRAARKLLCKAQGGRSEEHTSELQSLMRISYAVFCLKKKKKTIDTIKNTQ